MSAPVISEVAEGSPAAIAGLAPGDTVVSINDVVPLDVIEYQQLVDGPFVQLLIRREGALLDRRVTIEKDAGAPLGIRVDSAVFDRIRTCDNHCEFCFIYQLPKGMRRSLYLKDDDYRLSFLYGNFTTLTRFTELDAERVITERLSPLYVSIHTTDPDLRAAMLRNQRGATSLRWLDELLRAGIEVHGQIVVCPGVNDGEHLARTLGDTLDRFGDLLSVGVVPLGISDHSNEPGMRAHATKEANDVLDLVTRFGDASLALTGRRRIYAADEYYLLAGRPFPPLSHYEDLTQVENGIGMSAALRTELLEGRRVTTGNEGGFFQAVDGAPPWGYRAVRSALDSPRSTEPPVLLTGTYGAMVLRSVLDELDRSDVEILSVQNHFFGGNIGVTGLLTAQDLTTAINAHGAHGRYILPDICLHEGRFLDGGTPEELPGTIEVIETSGMALAALLQQSPAPTEVPS